LYFDPFVTDGVIDNTERFCFTYAMGDPNSEKPWFNSHYDHNSMTWHLMGGSKTSDENSDEFYLDATLVVEAPGYVPALMADTSSAATIQNADSIQPPCTVFHII
jgi:hypothetical protein